MASGAAVSTDHGVIGTIRRTISRQADEYSRGAERPLGGYAVIIVAYAVATGAGVALVRARRRSLPSSISLRDLALVAAATFQLSRVITKKPITSALRAPFTTYDGTAGPAELQESVRGHGVRHAVGELVTCPFCTAHWIVTAFGFGLVLSPEVTRLVASMLTAEAAADFLQFAYARIQQSDG